MQPDAAGARGAQRGPDHHGNGAQVHAGGAVSLVRHSPTTRAGATIVARFVPPHRHRFLGVHLNVGVHGGRVGQVLHARSERREGGVHLAPGVHAHRRSQMHVVETHFHRVTRAHHPQLRLVLQSRVHAVVTHAHGQTLGKIVKVLFRAHAPTILLAARALQLAHRLFGQHTALLKSHSRAERCPVPLRPPTATTMFVACTYTCLVP